MRHETRRQLAHSIVDGYEAVLRLRSRPDLVVRLDSQEHDPAVILTIEDHFAHTDVSALFLPVIYTVAGAPRKRFAEIAAMMAEFDAAITRADREVLLRLYNQEFPVGYQAYRTAALEQIVPFLRRALGVYRDESGKDPSPASTSSRFSRPQLGVSTTSSTRVGNPDRKPRRGRGRGAARPRPHDDGHTTEAARQTKMRRHDAVIGMLLALARPSNRRRTSFARRQRWRSTR